MLEYNKIKEIKEINKTDKNKLEHYMLKKPSGYKNINASRTKKISESSGN